ncbi:MAG TPA: hypothetical protein VFF52_20720 [Isosphaeraceae bacterium]|nr:hypothetical protein [Isosphaeraceae bacterium]
MNLRKTFRPRLEPLESKMVMSVGASSVPVAAAAGHPGPVAAAHALAQVHRLVPGSHDASRSHGHSGRPVHSKPAKTVTLTGEATGDYTSTQGPPDTGTHYHLTAAGRLTPIGRAVVSGSFQTPGFIRGGQASGTLTIAAAHGTLTLNLTAPGPIRVNASTAAGPMILVNDFTYTITKGTGRYAHDKGLGRVVITTTPGLTVPTQPGIYAATPSITGSGQTTVTFETGATPLG